MTLVSNFITEASVAKLAAAMRRVLASERPLQLEFGGTEMFGLNRDIPVRLVRSEAAKTLHQELVAELTSVGDVVADEPAYWRAGYRPHMTLAPTAGTDVNRLRKPQDIVLARLDGDRATIVACVRLLADAERVSDVDVRHANVGDAHGLARLKIEWAGLDHHPSSQEIDEFADALSSWIARQGDSLVVEVAVADDQIVVGMAWMVLFERARTSPIGTGSRPTFRAST